MSIKKQKPKTPADIMKYEIAQELGLAEKVERDGWRGLTARESGKIGGIMAKRQKEKAKSHE
ncbi:MAG: alpha/beta-type small acid-soluble spore protein [Defluviitaleaceae bacterium]|nr:alpha/beta-type small acid-soluble spore protein [Defluviitaleaceae bacterium]